MSHNALHGCFDPSDRVFHQETGARSRSTQLFSGAITTILGQVERRTSHETN